MNEPTKTTFAKAFIKLQRSLKTLPKSQTNSHFHSNYSDITDVWNSIREPLASNGFFITQLLSYLDEGHYLETIITHESGESIKSSTRMILTRNDPQGFGSAVTYYKRYAICAMLGLVGSEEDDDGNAASNLSDKKTNEPKAPKKTEISEKQIARLWAIASSSGYSNADVHRFLKEGRKIDSVKDLTKKDYDSLCSYLEKNPKNYGELPK